MSRRPFYGRGLWADGLRHSGCATAWVTASALFARRVCRALGRPHPFLFAAALALGGCAGPREPMAVKVLDGCTLPQAALIAEGLEMWNRACGTPVFRFAATDDPIGDVRVLCADAASFGPSDAGEGLVVAAYYSTGEGKIRFPRLETARDAVRLPVIAAHELGHAAGLEHRDEPTSIMRPVYSTDLTRPSVSDVRALRDVGFRCDVTGER